MKAFFSMTTYLSSRNSGLPTRRSSKTMTAWVKQSDVVEGLVTAWGLLNKQFCLVRDMTCTWRELAILCVLLLSKVK